MASRRARLARSNSDREQRRPVDDDDEVQSSTEASTIMRLMPHPGLLQLSCHAMSAPRRAAPRFASLPLRVPEHRACVLVLSFAGRRHRGTQLQTDERQTQCTMYCNFPADLRGAPFGSAALQLRWSWNLMGTYRPPSDSAQSGQSIAGGYQSGRYLHTLWPWLWPYLTLRGSHELQALQRPSHAARLRHYSTLRANCLFKPTLNGRLRWHLTRGLLRACSLLTTPNQIASSKPWLSRHHRPSTFTHGLIPELRRQSD